MKKIYKYFIPTKNIIARGGLADIACLLPNECKNILLVTGKHSAKKSGYTDKIISSLALANKKTFLFDMVEEDPSIETVDSAANTALKNNCSAVIGLGGGSALDAAKAAAISAAVKIPVVELLEIKEKPNDKLFFVAVPTTSGTGSEATQYSLLSDRIKGTKLNLATENSFPDIALLDAELTISMPENLTRNTGVDALSHAIEGYLTTKANPVTDILAEGAILTIAENLHKVIEKPNDIDAREKMLLASNVAGRVIAHTGTSACHALGYYLTLVKGLPHGLANAVLLGRIVKWIEKFSPEKVKNIEKILKSDVNSFVENLGIDTSLSNYNVTNDDIIKMAESAAERSSTKATPGSPSADELVEILKTARNTPGALQTPNTD